jgi:hypothetical protein
MKYFYMSVIAPAFILVPVSVAIWKYNILTKETKVIFYYLVITAITNLASIILAANSIPNLEIFHVYTIIEALLLLQFFALIFQSQALVRLTRFLMIGFPLFCCINFIFIQGISSFNPYTRPVEGIMFMLLCMAYWWRTGDSDSTARWDTMPVNWILSGLLLYFSSTFFLFIFSGFMFSRYSIGVNKMIWNIHATLVATTHLLFAVGFSKCKK